MDLNSKKNKAVSSSEYDKNWIQDAWGDAGEGFQSLKGCSFRPRVKKALDLGDIQEGMKILDIGCGRGEILFYAIQQKAAEAIGVDYSKDVIALARETLALYPADQQKKIRFVQSDVKDLDFQEKYFDRIFLLDIVEHLHDWELDILFSKLRHYLKENGYIVIHTLPNKWVYEYGYRVVRIFFRRLPKDPRGEKEKIFHVNEQTLPHLASILKRNRFYYKINLAQLLPEQATWYRDHVFGDRRDILYNFMRNPIITVIFRLLSMTPLKLIISNDIYAIAYIEKDAYKHVRQNIVEKLFLIFQRNITGRTTVGDG